MHFNHPKTIPGFFLSVEKLSSMKPVPCDKKVEYHCCTLLVGM